MQTTRAAGRDRRSARRPLGRPDPIRLARAALGGAGIATLLLLGGCGGAPTNPAEDYGGPPDAVPKVEPKAKYGNMDSYVVFGQRYRTQDTSRNHVERGIASWYGPTFHGKKTSSGEIYDMHLMTAAHRTLPLPTYARVTNLDNGRSAVVRINDRGPFHDNRVIDLSYAAATKLGVVQKGTARVEVVSVDPRDHGGKVPERKQPALARGEPEAPVKSSRAARTASVGSASSGGSVAFDDAWQPSARPERARPTVAAAEPAPRGSTGAGATAYVESAAADAVVTQPASLPSGADGPAPAMIPAVASGAGGELFLQVGAFGTRDNAEQLRRRLAPVVANPVQVSEPGAGGTALYKVRVGPVASRADAADLSRQLSEMGIGRAIVIAD